MKKILIACVLSLLAVPALAQKTATPFVLQQYFDVNGNPLSEGGMCVFAAGTTTLATSYTTAAGSVDNANPILFDAAGRPDSNGFFLTPGVSYKLVLKDYTNVVTPSCTVPGSTGTTLWTQDNIMAIPSSSGLLEIATAQAGEAISANDAVYLSDGGGSRTAGRWYRTDADFAYASSEAPLVGVATSAISSGEIGTVVIQGGITLSSLTAGSAYFASATAGAMTTTAPTLVRVMGTAMTTTSFIVSPFNAYRIPALSSSYLLNAIALNAVQCGVLTLTTATPYTTADVTAATTVYFTPSGKCNQIALYTGSVWKVMTFTEVSIALGSDTTALPYDVFAYDNSGTVAIERLVWTNTTTRATALVLQDGVWSKTGALTRRYVGTYYTTGTGETSDSAGCRCVFNADNRVPRFLRAVDTTNSWVYDTATWRQARATATNQVAVVVGLPGETIVDLRLWAAAAENTNNAMGVGISEDVTTTPLIATFTGGATSGGATSIMQFSANLSKAPAVGYHFYAWLEIGPNTAGTPTWYGDNGGTNLQSGLQGWVR